MKKIILLFAVSVVLLNELNAQSPYSFKAKENRELSPYTGYTRKHWLEITENLIAGALPYFKTKSGMPEFPPDSIHATIETSTRLTSQKEGLERVMTAVIFYTTATGSTVVPGYKGSIVAPFLKAITKGTDPKDKDFWGAMPPNDQVGSMFALAVYLNPKLFWDPLSPRQKTNLLNYLKDQAYNSSYANNHYFFHMAPVALLEKNGVAANREQLNQRYEQLMGFYRGNGWFIDGNNQGFDYYNAWGFQLYNHLLYRYDPEWRTRYGTQLKSSTAEFLRTFSYFFGKDGGPVPIGRSLTYRFANVAAIGWSTLNGMNSLPAGEARRIASGCLKYFLDHGCVGKNGMLNIGFWSDNPVVGESYGSPGSPYWAAQALVCLLIPATDPFWTSVEQPMPADGKGGRCLIEGAQTLLRVSTIDGEARLFPIGQPFSHERTKWQVGIKYDQNAYSSYLGWCITGDGGKDLGAGRTGYSTDGATWQYQQKAIPVSMSEDHLVSKYQIQNGTGEVIIQTLVGDDGEIEIFWHTSPQPLYLYAGGYGISVIDSAHLKVEATNANLMLTGNTYQTIIKVIAGPTGQFHTNVVKPRTNWNSSHLFGGIGAFPNWQSDRRVLANTPVVLFINGTRNRLASGGEVSIERLATGYQIKFEGKLFTINLPK
jgi:hypothetical protein